MKTTVFAARLALLAGGPLAASAADSVAWTNTAATFVCQATTQSLNCMSAGQPVRPRFIGPSEVHHGLLPNGLTPNSFTYG